MSSYVPRIVDRELVEVLEAHPALLLVGPRGAGKTTTARRHAASVARLDRPAEAAAFEADADAALARLEGPILLDEWQAVPGVLAAVKRAVDDDRRPGRFLLTGSVRADLEAEVWPGTGRLVRLPMYTLNRRELTGNVSGPNPIDVIAAGDALTHCRRATEPSGVRRDGTARGVPGGGDPARGTWAPAMARELPRTAHHP